MVRGSDLIASPPKDGGTGRGTGPRYTCCSAEMQCSPWTVSAPDGYEIVSGRPGTAAPPRTGKTPATTNTIADAASSRPDRWSTRTGDNVAVRSSSGSDAVAATPRAVSWGGACPAGDGRGPREAGEP